MAAPGRTGQPVALQTSEREQLERWVRRRTSPQRLALRSRIVLLAATGVAVTEIARRLLVSPATVRLWTARFIAGGVGALVHDRPGRGRPAGALPALALAVVDATRRLGPAVGARAIAAASGASASTVFRTWRRHRIDAATTRATLDAIHRQLISDSKEAPR